MKRFMAAILAALLLASANCAFAKEVEVSEVIRLDCEPVRYLVWYTDKQDTRSGWDYTDGYWSLVDAQGNVIEEYFAREVYEEDSGIYVVETGGLYGFMDATGSFLTEPRYQKVRSFYEGFAVAKLGDLYGYIDEAGKLAVEPVFEEASNFSEGLANVKKDGLWGYVNTRGEYVFEPAFDNHYNFYHGYAYVKKDGKNLLLDASGAVLAETTYGISYCWRNEGETVIEISTTNAAGALRYGYMFADGSVIEPRFKEVYNFTGSGTAAVNLDGLWGLIDRTGAFIAEPVYEYCDVFEDGIAAVVLNGLWGFIDESGEYVIEPQFETVSTSGAYIRVKKDGLWGTLGRDGSYLIPPGFEYLGSFYDGYAEATQGGLAGLVDESGNWVVQPQYAVIGDRNARCAVVSMDKEAEWWDVYDKAPGAGLVSLPEGKLLLGLGHDNISIAYDDGTVSATKDGVTRIYRLSDGELYEISSVDGSLDLSVYLPNSGEKVARLSDKAGLDWHGDSPLPRLDGATALLPVYAAFAQATYPKELRYTRVSGRDDWGNVYEDTGDALFTCTKTAMAYDRLISGKTDMIFRDGPSDEELITAKLNGVELELTPIGYEAFVFIVNGDNPVDSISVEQIRQVYSGEITSWAEFGHPELGDIIAYQRPDNSGSQTALEKLMNGKALMRAPEYVTQTMEGIVDNIAYRNFENAIGYSFRFFVSGMMGSDVKLLKIDGVAPTEENIRSGAYPVITTVYAVTRKDEGNPNVSALLEWITGPEGQELIEKSGYVGLAR